MNLKIVVLGLSVIILSSLPFCCNAQKYVSEESGDIMRFAIPMVALTSSLIWRDENGGTKEFAKSLGLSLAVTHSLKWIINKERPNGEDYSFPSGHVAMSFTGAAFIQKKYGWKYGIPAYACCTYVGWTRINAKKHDFVDVLSGAIIGIGSAYLFTSAYNSENIDISFNREEDHFLTGLQYTF